MAGNGKGTSKALIITAITVITISILAVVIVLVVTFGGEKKTPIATEVNETRDYAEAEELNRELSHDWEPKCLDYVPEETGDKVANSIDKTIENITDPYEINLFGVNDKQRYAVILACMYSYENLDKRGQEQVKNFDKLVTTYKELNGSLNSGMANVDSSSVNYGRYSDYNEINNGFSKVATVSKELYKEGEYFIDSYTLGVKRHIFSDPTLEWTANYSKSDDIYLYTFDVTFNRVNPDQNEVVNGPVHVYLKSTALYNSDQYAGDVTFDNCLSASGQFAITSTRSYSADDFDSLFTYDYGDLEKVYVYESSANFYHHELMPEAEFCTFAYVYGDFYYQDIEAGKTFPNDIEFIYPGENVNYGPGFWPMIYRKGARPE